MAMNTKAISRLGAIIGGVEEVETNEDGECIGEIARVRIRVDVTKPLKKIIFLESEGEEKVPMPVTYERLPDFCFCCGIIDHQFRECVKYKTQKQENFAFGPWMKAVTVSECLNHNKSKDRWNRSNNTRMEENGQQDDLRNQNQTQRQPNSTTETGSEAIQIETGESAVPISKSHVAAELDKQLTLKGEKSMQQPLGCKDQITTAGKKEMLRNVDKKVGEN